MRITKTPQQFAPISEGLLFAFDTEETEPRDVDVEIVNIQTNEVVATQHLTGVTKGEVDIAPYVERFAFRAPASYTTTTILDEGYCTAYRIRIDGIESPVAIVSTNRTTVAVPQILSDMPQRRKISDGESDEVLIFASLGSTVSIHIKSADRNLLSLSHTTQFGVSRLTLVAADFYNEESIEVSIFVGMVEVGKITYTIVAPSRGEVRLAWESDSGAIERYTFPFARKVRREVERERIKRVPLPQSVSVSTTCHLHLASRYERAATIEALQQIISSPRVWIDQGENFQRVEVVNSHTERGLQGKPDCVELELSLWRKEVAL